MDRQHGEDIMETATGFLTQSKFYSPAFNAAIFDGPIRIYFAQYQENLALQIYFQIQKKFKMIMENTKNLYVQKGKSIFVMLYPTSESFYMSFDKSHRKSPSEDFLVVEDRLGDDMVLGVRGPLKEDNCEQVYQSIEAIFAQNMPSFLAEGQGA